MRTSETGTYLTGDRNVHFLYLTVSFHILRATCVQIDLHVVLAVVVARYIPLSVHDPVPHPEIIAAPAPTLTPISSPYQLSLNQNLMSTSHSGLASGSMPPPLVPPLVPPPPWRLAGLFSLFNGDNAVQQHTMDECGGLCRLGVKTLVT